MRTGQDRTQGQWMRSRYLCYKVECREAHNDTKVAKTCVAHWYLDMDEIMCLLKKVTCLQFQKLAVLIKSSSATQVYSRDSVTLIYLPNLYLEYVEFDIIRPIKGILAKSYQTYIM